MFFKDFVSVKREKIKRGASQTYDTPSFYSVRLIGFEPTRPEPLDPKSSASTNFATSAFVTAKIQLIFQLKEEKYKKL